MREIELIWMAPLPPSGLSGPPTADETSVRTGSSHVNRPYNPGPVTFAMGALPTMFLASSDELARPPGAREAGRLEENERP